MRFKLVNNVNENWSSENTNGMKIGLIAFCSLLLLDRPRHSGPGQQFMALNYIFSEIYTACLCLYPTGH